MSSCWGIRFTVYPNEHGNYTYQVFRCLDDVSSGELWEAPTGTAVEKILKDEFPHKASCVFHSPEKA
jgi:hypothetical protein